MADPSGDVQHPRLRPFRVTTRVTTPRAQASPRARSSAFKTPGPTAIRAGWCPCEASSRVCQIWLS